ncbi:hypothetical protein Srubr_27460 [Streptomyces rubradiris]|uniref:Uncharacterized protein n=1 Tax=Streptomyces rubradiris TaxID=285531 RepID=A0ABQ3RAL5_STRRR|nr:hypothetical protein [Streptomyces rubradiris]GHI52900.1 hypothetical protein Srubr_27460 [Streptomyces rubradiris]
MPDGTAVRFGGQIDQTAPLVQAFERGRPAESPHRRLGHVGRPGDGVADTDADRALGQAPQGRGGTGRGERLDQGQGGGGERRGIRPVALHPVREREQGQDAGDPVVGEETAQPAGEFVPGQAGFHRAGHDVEAVGPQLVEQTVAQDVRGLRRDDEPAAGGHAQGLARGRGPADRGSRSETDQFSRALRQSARAGSTASRAWLWWADSLSMVARAAGSASSMAFQKPASVARPAGWSLSAAASASQKCWRSKA